MALQARRKSTQQERDLYGSEEFISLPIDQGESQGFIDAGFEIIGSPEAALNEAPKPPVVVAPKATTTQKTLLPEQALPQDTTVPTFDSQIDELTQAGQDILQGQIDQLGTIRAGANKALEATIAGIQQMMEKRRREQQRINKARLGSLRTIASVTGRQRFASELSVGQLNQEEQQGISRIQEIDNAEQQLIQSATQAAQDNDMDLFFQQSQLLREKHAEKVQALRDLGKKQTEQLEYLREKARFDMEQQDFAFVLEERKRADQE